MSLKNFEEKLSEILLRPRVIGPKNLMEQARLANKAYLGILMSLLTLISAWIVFITGMSSSSKYGTFEVSGFSALLGLSITLWGIGYGIKSKEKASVYLGTALLLIHSSMFCFDVLDKTLEQFFIVATISLASVTIVFLILFLIGTFPFLTSKKSPLNAVRMRFHIATTITLVITTMLSLEILFLK